MPAIPLLWERAMPAIPLLWERAMPAILRFDLRVHRNARCARE
jgi:hypothetical protein